MYTGQRRAGLLLSNAVQYLCIYYTSEQLGWIIKDNAMEEQDGIITPSRQDQPGDLLKHDQRRLAICGDQVAAPGTHVGYRADTRLHDHG